MPLQPFRRLIALTRLAFALGLAILAMGVGLAHADSRPPAAPQQVATQQIAQGLLPSPPNDSFVCHARPGGWCDLRDWRGFGQATMSTQSAQLRSFVMRQNAKDIAVLVGSLRRDSTSRKPALALVGTGAERR